MARIVALGVGGDTFLLLLLAGAPTGLLGIWFTVAGALGGEGCGDPGGDTSYRSSKSLGDTGLVTGRGRSSSSDIRSAVISVVDSLIDR